MVYELGYIVYGLANYVHILESNICFHLLYRSHLHGHLPFIF